MPQNNDQVPATALDTIRHHLNAAFSSAQSSAVRDQNVIAALVRKGGGSVHLSVNELSASDWQTHHLESVEDEDGQGVTISYRRNEPQRPKPALVGVDGKPLNGAGN